jgi:CheY-like chemotaxis protein
MVGAEAVEAECVQTITQKLGHKVETVKRGNDALLIDKSKNFDLILLDLFLPDMKGHELIPKIKKAPSCRNILWLFILGLQDPHKVIKLIGEEFSLL